MAVDQADSTPAVASTERTTNSHDKKREHHNSVSKVHPNGSAPFESLALLGSVNTAPYSACHGLRAIATAEALTQLSASVGATKVEWVQRMRLMCHDALPAGSNGVW